MNEFAFNDIGYCQNFFYGRGVKIFYRKVSNGD
jgi:hypothetical protein